MQELLPEDFLAADGLVPGWFGKVPMLGDFVSRRLAPTFTAPWDAWVAAGIQASQQELGSSWLEIYLNGPIWRFGLAPGLLDDRYWFGVLMPSVDRVGRYFPLTIAAAFTLPPSPPLAALEAWFEGLARAALGVLADDASVDGFEARLTVIPAPVFYPFSAEPAGGEDGVFARLPAHNGIADAFLVAAASLLRREWYGASFWWPRIEHEASTPISLCRGLPHARLFGRLMRGAL